MGYDTLFALVFASQVLLLSGVCPARVQALRRLAAGTSSGVYTALNVVVALIGFALLAAMLSLVFFDQMTPLLLSIGAFFFLQLSTLALPGARWIWSSARDAAAPLSEEQRQSARLFDFVSPVAVAIALVMAGGYAAFLAFRLSGADGAQVLKLGIFLLTQSCFAFVILSSFRALKQDASPEAGTRHQSFTVAAPLLVFASIMISAYYFGKEGLASAGLPQLRPIMMSAFLQLVGVLLFNALYQLRHQAGRRPWLTRACSCRERSPARGGRSHRAPWSTGEAQRRNGQFATCETTQTGRTSSSSTDSGR